MELQKANKNKASKKFRDISEKGITCCKYSES